MHKPSRTENMKLVTLWSRVLLLGPLVSLQASDAARQLEGLNERRCAESKSPHSEPGLADLQAFQKVRASLCQNSSSLQGLSCGYLVWAQCGLLTVHCSADMIIKDVRWQRLVLVFGIRSGTRSSIPGHDIRELITSIWRRSVEAWRSKYPGSCY